MQATDKNPITLTLTLNGAEAEELLRAVRVHGVRYDREVLQNPRYSETSDAMRAILRSKGQLIYTLERKVQAAIINTKD